MFLSSPDIRVGMEGERVRARPQLESGRGSIEAAYKILAQPQHVANRAVPAPSREPDLSMLQPLQHVRSQKAALAAPGNNSMVLSYSKTVLFHVGFPAIGFALP